MARAVVRERRPWAILVYAGGGVGEQISAPVLAWEEAWTARSVETACALAAALINGARQLGSTWRPLAALEGRTGRVISGPGMIGALGLLRGIEMGTVPSVTDEPPGPFDVQWPEPGAAHPEGWAPDTGEAGEYPLILLFARGASGEEVGSIVLPWTDDDEEPGAEAALCGKIAQVWARIDASWRFAAALSGGTGRVLATPAMMGQVAALGHLGQAPAGAPA